jgi:Protein of unknown function (DUF3435)
MVCLFQILTCSTDNSPDHKDSNDTIRNNIMDHNHPDTIKSYISRTIKFDVQAAFLREEPNVDLHRALGRMCLLADRSRPRKCSDLERDRIRDEPLMRKLYKERDQLHRSIKKRHGFINCANGTKEGILYQKLTKKIKNTMHLRER